MKSDSTAMLRLLFVLLLCHLDSDAFLQGPANIQRPSTGVEYTFQLEQQWHRQQQTSRGGKLACRTRKLEKTLLRRSYNDDNENGISSDADNSSMKRNIYFSLAMIFSGAALGPFLDAYHSAFGVLQYNQPLSLVLWGSPEYPALTTTQWVPPLFGLAGFIIGWLYILLDRTIEKTKPEPSGFQILIGISFFTFQYWLSGILVSSGVVDRTSLLNLMSVLAAAGFVALDSTFSGFVTSTATAVGGPLIEAGILQCTKLGLFGLDQTGYHYNDLGETGFFPLWISPIYFLGGPAVGNLARGIWSQLGVALDVESRSTATPTSREPPGCTVCNDTRCVPCPNCDGVGSYMAMGNRSVKCTSCRGRGFVICRACFDYYDDDPNDIEGIREIMRRMPD